MRRRTGLFRAHEDLSLIGEIRLSLGIMMRIKRRKEFLTFFWMRGFFPYESRTIHVILLRLLVCLSMTVFP